MHMPDEALRAEVAGQDPTEEACAHSLDRIAESLTAELKNLEFSVSDMSAIYAWSSLVSFAVGITYAPASRMKYPGFAALIAQPRCFTATSG